jgi:hypothetical protein
MESETVSLLDVALKVKMMPRRVWLRFEVKEERRCLEHP